MTGAGDRPLKNLIALEDAMDAGKDLEGPLQCNPELARMVEAALQDRWQVIYEEADRIIRLASASTDTKAFALQWAVIACEVEFDLHRRKRWLSRWDDFAWGDSAYCQYLQSYQLGLSSFFEGSLREAEARFKRGYDLALSIGYSRGEQRCLFHLGLVQRDLYQAAASLDYLSLALIIARKREDLSYTKRIQTQIDRVSGKIGRKPNEDSSEISLADARALIEAKIDQGQFEEARTLLARAELRRRKFKQGRKREALASYLPLLLLGRKRITSEAAWKRLSRQRDPILKIRLMDVMDRISPLIPAWKAALSALKSIHGISEVVKQASLDQDVEICGVLLGSIPDEEIRGFMKLLLESPDGVQKETISEKLWKLEYDPVTHDGRIYKLVHRVRKFFKRPDLLLNTYGAYMIDPRYQIRKTGVRSETPSF